MGKVTKKEILIKVESYAKEAMSKLPNNNSHRWRHVDRVRKWALKIGRQEGDVDLFILEVTALLHDIGYTEKNGMKNHYQAGANKAAKYLRQLNFFSAIEIEKICKSILDHGLGGKSKLTKILQDADRMDLWGAIGISRGSKDFSHLPIYVNKESFQYRPWSQKEINRKFSNPDSLKSILDVHNLCLSIYQTVNTKTAKLLAGEKIKFMKEYIKQLKKETIEL